MYRPIVTTYIRITMKPQWIIVLKSLSMQLRMAKISYTHTGGADSTARSRILYFHSCGRSLTHNKVTVEMAVSTASMMIKTATPDRMIVLAVSSDQLFVIHPAATREWRGDA